MTVSDRYSVLTRIGPGTPMGQYMRFFWHPIAAVAELKDHPRPVRVLGEDLVLFRTGNGTLGLLAQRCAHRSASLGCGMIEDDGIRCAYHAWKYDLSGQCVDIPSERGDRKVSSRVKIPAYQVHEAGGLIWAYLGKQPAPLFPRYEFIVGEQYDHDVGLSELPCNWLQVAENNMDPYHVEYLHFMYTNYVHEKIGKPKIQVRQHAKIDFEVFEHGIIKRRLWEGDSENSEEWTIGHPQIWPGTAIVTYPNGQVQAQIRTPIDDTNTRIYWYNAKPRPAGKPADPICPTFENPFRKTEGGYHVETLNGQDMMVMFTQGDIADRTLETLVDSDRGVVLYRRVLLEQLDRIARGEDPLGVVRDPAQNTPFITLPMEKHVDYSLAGVAATPDRSWDDSTPKEAAE